MSWTVEGKAKHLVPATLSYDAIKTIYEGERKPRLNEPIDETRTWKLKKSGLSAFEIELFHINYIRERCGLQILTYRPAECMSCLKDYQAQFSGSRKITHLCGYCRAKRQVEV